MIGKIVKVMVRITIVLIIYQFLTIPTIHALSWDEIFTTGDDFVANGKSASQGENSVVNTAKVKDTSTDVYNVLVTLGVALAVIIGGILGIQMMGGSIEQQVKAKEMLAPYGIGCVVVFGAFGIWKLAVTIFSQL